MSVARRDRLRWYVQPGTEPMPAGTQYLTTDVGGWDWRDEPALTPDLGTPLRALSGTHLGSILDKVTGASANAMALAMIEVLDSPQGKSVVDKLASAGADAAASAAKTQILKVSVPVLLLGVLIGYRIGRRRSPA
jgi:hypothetical protein